MSNDMVVGIDLGTTNSEIAGWLDGRVQILGPKEATMLPSCVGISPGGELLIGQAARNQRLLYPERTAQSVKRRMGSSEPISLGDKQLSPQEVSALIVRALKEWAEKSLGKPVEKAVITVPAYFSDAQRLATREAGELCGLEVLRILNEPTAASLAYGHGDSGAQCILVYDLGGGTFDVSVVSLEGDVTEVLASHGNNRLGGDDLDLLLFEQWVREFESQHGVDLRDGHRQARARLLAAAEQAKKDLSSTPFATIREENLVSKEGRPLHFELELSREGYEELILPLVESTLDSVSTAMSEAGRKASDLDAVLLVGGSTRIPLVSRLLAEHTGLEPSSGVHPDLCVALGAGVQASRLAGHSVERVLVDVSPYSFGPSHVGERDGLPYPYCYKPIISRNTPLPVTRTESYYTSYPGQQLVEIDIFQGDDPDALKNIPVGAFTVEDLTPTQDANEILCRMSLNLDGILEVTAIEKSTGKAKQITIEQALEQKTEAEIEKARFRLERLYSETGVDIEDAFIEGETLPDLYDPGQDRFAAAGTLEDPEPEEESAWQKTKRHAERLLERSRIQLSEMHSDDKEEVVSLHESIVQAIGDQDAEALSEAVADLDELLFFVEGR